MVRTRLSGLAPGPRPPPGGFRLRCSERERRTLRGPGMTAESAQALGSTHPSDAARTGPVAPRGSSGREGPGFGRKASPAARTARATHAPQATHPRRVHREPASPRQREFHEPCGDHPATLDTRTTHAPECDARSASPAPLSAPRATRRVGGFGHRRRSELGNRRPRLTTPRGARTSGLGRRTCGREGEDRLRPAHPQRRAGAGRSRPTRPPWSARSPASARHLP